MPFLNMETWTPENYVKCHSQLKRFSVVWQSKKEAQNSISVSGVTKITSPTLLSYLSDDGSKF